MQLMVSELSFVCVFPPFPESRWGSLAWYYSFDLVWHTPGVTFLWRLPDSNVTFTQQNEKANNVFQVCYRKWVKLECFLKLSYGDSLLPASFRKQTKVLSALTRTHYSSYWSYPSFNCTGDMAFICTQRIILYIHIYIIDITIPVSDNACYYTCIFNVYCL